MWTTRQTLMKYARASRCIILDSLSGVHYTSATVNGVNMKWIMGLLLCVAGQALAATEPTPMPEYAQHVFLSELSTAVLVLLVLGFVGLLVATANKINLHYGLGDIYLSAPVSLVCWAGGAWLFYMGYRGDDLLPYLETRLWCAGGMVAVPVVYSFFMVRRCNPGRNAFALVSGTLARLFADMLYQLCSLLLVLCTLLLILGGRKKEGDKPGIINMIITVLGIGLLNKCVWGTIKSTTLEPVSGNGYLVAFLHLLCFGGSIYGVYTYVQHNPQKDASALVQAVRAHQPELALELMAMNPMMGLDAGVQEAVEKRNLIMLNHIVRGSAELDVALAHARNHNLTSVVRFLEEKARLSEPASAPSAP